jgi:NAD(P)-dependent dehydrogenase (short-subunit alcohol dehydrogenase family)
MAAARAFAARGATVIAVARREERLAALVDELGGAPHSYVRCDVTDLEDVRSMAAVVASRSDHLDLLLANAGIPGPGPILGATSEEVERVIRTNLLGPIWCLIELLPLLDMAPRTDRTPIIANLASMAGRMPVPQAPFYTAAKFGLVGFTEAAWSDLGSKGIRAMLVNPAFTETEGFPMDELRATPGLKGIVMKPDRVARAIVSGIERGAFEVRVQWWWSIIHWLGLVSGPLKRIATARASGLAGRIGE